MRRKNFNARNIAIILFFTLLLILSLIKEPICFFPPEPVATRDPLYHDIESKQKVLEEEGEVIQHHIGDSMIPYIFTGQVCICEKREEYREGDVVSFYTYINGELMFVVHRIVEILPDGWILTKGDNVLNTDAPIQSEQVFCAIKEKSLLESAIENMFEKGEDINE